jgi:peptidoglycan/xylan/chitin deacetylase (PgdA/CDA1 family)
VGGVTCLTYHRVLPAARLVDYPAPLAVSPEMFERHAAWLKTHCTVMTVSAALDSLKSPWSGPPRVCVTFDDGYADNAEIAGPILKRHGLVATFFVVTGFVESGAPLWYDLASAHWRRTGPEACTRALARTGRRSSAPRAENEWMEALKGLEPAARSSVLQELNRIGDPIADPELYRPMPPQEARRLAEAGHEIGSHTDTHPLLPQLDHGALASELSESRRKLALWLGVPVRGLCYPNGDYDDRVERAALKAGYGYACTTSPGINRAGGPVMRLRRRHIQGSDVTDPAGAPSDGAFAAEVWGVHGLLRRARRPLRRS